MAKIGLFCGVTDANSVILITGYFNINATSKWIYTNTDELNTSKTTHLV